MDKNIIASNKEWIDETFVKIDEKLQLVAVRSRNKIPYTAANGVHDDMMQTNPAWWTNGFWAGMMWLMYNYTKNQEYRITAENAENIMDKAFEKFEGLHHDVGFMWHLMSGASYRLTGNEKSKLRNIYAACVLASRFNVDGGFIQAWNNHGDIDHSGRTIIDTLMNLSLLFWASEETGNARYKRMATAHMDMAIRHHIRPDGSVRHIVEHNPDTGEYLFNYAGQGYSEDSCWSRGQAWAIYGSVSAYIHTHNKDYLDTAIKTANYFLANCAQTSYRTLVDFRAPLNPVYYDATAGACAASALLQLSEFVSENECKTYTDAAIKILRATDCEFCDYSKDSDPIVVMGTERYPLKSMKGVHIPIIYGDFFFVEAMLKLKNQNFYLW